MKFIEYHCSAQFCPDSLIRRETDLVSALAKAMASLKRVVIGRHGRRGIEQRRVRCCIGGLVLADG